MQHVCTKNSKRWIQSKVKGFGLWRTASFVTGFIYLFKKRAYWPCDIHLTSTWLLLMVPRCLCVSVHLSPQLFLLQPSSLAAFRSFRFITNLYSCIASADEPVKGWTLWSGLHCRPCRHTFTLPLTWGHAVTLRSPSVEYTRPIHKTEGVEFYTNGPFRW